MNKLTKEEFIAKYGDYVVTFESYYKYTFTYSAVLPSGKTLVVGYGGNHDDIYGHEVSKDAAETINTLQPYSGDVYEGGACVEEFYDY